LEAGYREEVEARYREQIKETQEQVQKERTLFTESIKNMMNSLNMSVEEVMSKMKIPPEKQSIYRDLIKMDEDQLFKV